jgi:hypothetical protein
MAVHGVVIAPQIAVALHVRTAMPCQPLATTQAPCTVVPAVALGHAAFPSSGSAAQNATTIYVAVSVGQLFDAYAYTRMCVPEQALVTLPQVPSGLHVRMALPMYVSSHAVDVTDTAVAPAAVTGHDAYPSTAPDAVGWQNTSVTKINTYPVSTHASALMWPS